MAASTFTVMPRNTNENAPSQNPNASARSGEIWWAGSGRLRVLRITSSMSRSRYMLIALAAPAASEPPTRVASTSQSEGTPPSASTIAGTVVMSSNTMIRGFVRRK